MKTLVSVKWKKVGNCDSRLEWFEEDEDDLDCLFAICGKCRFMLEMFDVWLVSWLCCGELSDFLCFYTTDPVGVGVMPGVKFNLNPQRWPLLLRPWCQGVDWGEADASTTGAVWWKRPMFSEFYAKYIDMQDGMFHRSVSVSIGKSQKNTFGKGRALEKNFEGDCIKPCVTFNKSDFFTATRLPIEWGVTLNACHACISLAFVITKLWL